MLFVEEDIFIRLVRYVNYIKRYLKDSVIILTFHIQFDQDLYLIP